MVLKDFSGGINTRVSPSLLPSNQAQEYTNIDNSSGSLKSILGPTSTGIPISSWYTYYYANSEWVHRDNATNFVEYRDILYSSNGQDLQQYDGTTTKSLGIAKPVNILDTSAIKPCDVIFTTATASSTGLVPALTYNYKIGVYSGSLDTIIYYDYSYILPFLLGIYNDIVLTLSDLNLSYFSTNSSVKIYREYEGNYYEIYSTTFGTGISFTDSLLNISTLPKLDKLNNYTYIYTYYDSATGIESAPNLPSEESSGLGAILGLTASTDISVDTIRLYRLGGALTAYTLVEELSNTSATYTDKLSDIEIAGNTVMDSTNNDIPIAGLNYISEAYAMLFAAKGDKLYYSDIAKPYAWPAINFIDFDSTITGIGAISTGLLVFTKYKTFIITGNSPESFSKYLLSGSQGCLDHNTIQFIDNNLLWLSSDGICMTSGGGISVPTMSLLGPLKFNTIYNSAVLDNIYYLSFYTALGNMIMAFDFRYNQVIRYISCDGSYISSKKDKLYQVYNDTLQILLEGEPLEFIYKSPILTEDSYTNYKAYKDLYIRYDGIFNIKIYIDGKLSGEIDLDGDTVYNLKALGISKGYSIEFKIVGTGTIYEIEYKVLGRQNGK